MGTGPGTDASPVLGASRLPLDPEDRYVLRWTSDGQREEQGALTDAAPDGSTLVPGFVDGQDADGTWHGVSETSRSGGPGSLVQHEVRVTAQRMAPIPLPEREARYEAQRGAAPDARVDRVLARVRGEPRAPRTPTATAGRGLAAGRVGYAARSAARGRRGRRLYQRMPWVTLGTTLEYPMAKTTIGVKVDEATRDRLRALAQARDRTPHWMVRTALLEYLEREEQAERERAEDAARWERYVLTGEAVLHEQVRDWLGELADGQDTGCPR